MGLNKGEEWRGEGRRYENVVHEEVAVKAGKEEVDGYAVTAAGFGAG